MKNKKGTLRSVRSVLAYVRGLRVVSVRNDVME